MGLARQELLVRVLVIIVKMGILEQLLIIVQLAQLKLILMHGSPVLQKQTAVSVPPVIQPSVQSVRHLASQPQVVQMAGMGHLLLVRPAILIPIMTHGFQDQQPLTAPVARWELQLMEQMARLLVYFVKMVTMETPQILAMHVQMTIIILHGFLVLQFPTASHAPPAAQHVFQLVWRLNKLVSCVLMDTMGPLLTIVSLVVLISTLDTGTLVPVLAIVLIVALEQQLLETLEGPCVQVMHQM